MRSLQRHSAALCCERFKGRHTYDCIAAKLNAVDVAFRIKNKVIMTVTDNGSNFVKAFKEYKADDDVDADGDKVDDDNVLFVDVDTVLNDSGQNDDSDFYLPQHQRCASHTLNLIASHDIEKANNDASYKRVCRSTMAKCSSLWSKSSRSTQCADIPSIHPSIHLYLLKNFKITQCK